MDNGDMLSSLPNDLLISILSRLTLKEATRASVLSRQWEKLWTFYHGDMDFNVLNIIGQDRCSNDVRWVDKAMDALEQVETGGGMLDSFTVRFNSCPVNFTSVDRWVQYALERRTVKRLILAPETCYSHNCFLAYDLPPLRSPNSLQWNTRALTSLRFKQVNLSCEIIQHFFSNCPLLQSLDLVKLRKPLTHLRVSGETLALRHLAISECPDLTHIELSAPNLVSLNYKDKTTKQVKFDIRNVPKLVEFTIGINYGYSCAPALVLHIFTCFSYIQKFELDIYYDYEGSMDLTKLTELTSVKHFTIKSIGSGCKSILAWIPLLEAFPALEKFTLHMYCRTIDGIEGIMGWHATFPNKHVKEFEFIGFDRCIDDVELVRHFLKNMGALKKILIHCDGGIPNRADGIYFDKKHRVEAALNNAMHLKAIIPKEVWLVISHVAYCK